MRPNLWRRSAGAFFLRDFIFDYYSNWAIIFGTTLDRRDDLSYQTLVADWAGNTVSQMWCGATLVAVATGLFWPRPCENSSIFVNDGTARDIHC